MLYRKSDQRRMVKHRQHGIGGSDIASMLGINPFHSPLALYWDKVSEIKEEEGEMYRQK